jgi:hypothetical protein
VAFRQARQAGCKKQLEKEFDEDLCDVPRSSQFFQKRNTLGSIFFSQPSGTSLSTCAGAGARVLSGLVR